MESYEFRATFSDSEKYKLTLLQMFSAKPMKRGIAFIVIAYGLIAALALYQSGNNSGFEIDISSLKVFIFPIVLVSVILIGPFILIKLMKTGSPNYKFNEGGIILSNNGKDFNFPWEKFSEYKETTNYIMIRQSNSQLFSHVIKKSEFSNYNQLKAFTGFLERHGVKRKG